MEIFTKNLSTNLWGGGGGVPHAKDWLPFVVGKKHFQKKRKENQFFVNFGPVLEFVRLFKEEDPFKNQNFFFLHFSTTYSILCLSVYLSITFSIYTH